ncbi:hypothetical protein Glove_132g114 [Diversispora epigaea]|uniref:Uncharacterized protein n=1 Tax=Diversispora epigaea TaxID=1348612 RepID=A0A397IXE1_9GLOM|nr:hypothetical protein Glove_132g114 [Diversispora epigaea]
MSMFYIKKISITKESTAEDPIQDSLECVPYPHKILKQRMNPVNGIGTTKDEEKAFQFSLNQLKEEIDYCCQHGIETTKDEVKAFQWYLKSAKGENNIGKNNLANCYHDGRKVII